MKFKFQKHEEYYDLLRFPYFDSNISFREGLYYFTLSTFREDYTERTDYCFDNLEKIQQKVLEKLLEQCVKALRICLLNKDLSDIMRVIRRECGLINVQERNFKYIIRHCKRFIRLHNTYGQECIDWELKHVYEQLNEV